ncbi:MAG TPA: ELM1/GtrOC1 family putative glycosyltransferase [Sphingomicrobium sp.]|nr:ELM1/GtrOC1 family putative glycosyltransferase [Sphingomicrobium sp.]
MSAERVPVWVLLGRRRGDNNQLLRLANELGVPFRALELSYNPLYRIPPALLGASLATLDKASRRQIRPPWPDLVLGIGNRSVPPALAIRRLSGGKSKLVRLGNPRLHPRHFDLIITTPQYGVADAPNVIRLPAGIGTASKLEPILEEAQWLARLARPHRLLLIGGDSFMWRLGPNTIAGAASRLKEKPGGSTIAVASARTGEANVRAVTGALRGSDHGLVWGSFPRYPVLLDDADEIYVTADSVAMISDSVATGKPVGLVLPQKTFSGRLFYSAAKFGLPVPIRDLCRFWTRIQASGLAGTLDRPIAGTLPIDPLGVAVPAIRKLL